MHPIGLVVIGLIMSGLGWFGVRNFTAITSVPGLLILLPILLAFLVFFVLGSSLALVGTVLVTIRLSRLAIRALSHTRSSGGEGA